jgi:hypothetical protein
MRFMREVSRLRPPCTDAKGDHRHIVRGRQGHGGGDVFIALAEHHRVGRRHVEGRFVAAVLFAHHLRGAAAVAEARLQGRQQRGGHGPRDDGVLGQRGVHQRLHGRCSRVEF